MSPGHVPGGMTPEGKRDLLQHMLAPEVLAGVQVRESGEVTVSLDRAKLQELTAAVRAALGVFAWHPAARQSPAVLFLSRFYVTLGCLR